MAPYLLPPSSPGSWYAQRHPAAPQALLFPAGSLVYTDANLLDKLGFEVRLWGPAGLAGQLDQIGGQIETFLSNAEEMFGRKPLTDEGEPTTVAPVHSTSTYSRICNLRRRLAGLTPWVDAATSLFTSRSTQTCSPSPNLNSLCSRAGSV